MDADVFYQRVLGHIESAYQVSAEIKEAARLSAETDTGIAVSLLTDRDVRFRWLENRTKYHVFSKLYEEAARKFDADDAKMSQRFRHFWNVLQFLTSEWERDLVQEVKQYQGRGISGVFEVYEPSFLPTFH